MGKFFIYLISFCFVILQINYSQELSKEAKYIKQNYPNDYENNIKQYAISKWNDNHSMILYEINEQSKAFFEIYNNVESDNVKELIDAILKWSFEDYHNYNNNLMKEIKNITFGNLIKFKSNWNMVNYEFKNQLKAKNAY